MTRKQAIRLVRRSGGKLCIRYVPDPKTSSPIFADRFGKIARNAGAAAGVLTASMMLSTAAFAQGGNEPQQLVQIENSIRTGGTAPSISGYVTDPNGAAIPFAIVSVVNQETLVSAIQNASNEGFYEFKDLAPSKYTIHVEAGGFAIRDVTDIWVGESGETRRDAQLSLQNMEAVVQVGSGDDRNYNVTVDGGMSIVVETRNALIQAVLSEDLDEVKARIMMRSKINVKDKAYDGITPLHAAIETGNIEITRYLLEHGAKTNIRDFQKRTPLMMMDEDATPELFDLLTQYGAKLNLVDKEKNNMLHHAAVNGVDADLVKRIALNGVPINGVNKEGKTPLMTASEEGDVDIVNALIQSGADVNVRTRANVSAWDLSDNARVRAVLETYGAYATPK
ncbi:MAG TPA: ankyrin repeat domain-containing protein [Pyrinomonadaceae bacterium]|nr:ankyrin repeat domain-containing protein [Pyrinomonadaceae bacterium]